MTEMSKRASGAANGNERPRSRRQRWLAIFCLVTGVASGIVIACTQITAPSPELIASGKAIFRPTPTQLGEQGSV